MESAAAPVPSESLEAVAANSPAAVAAAPTPTKSALAPALTSGVVVHPKNVARRLLGATDTLSSTYDTLCPFSRPQRAALSPTNGLIYVCDHGNNRVQALTATGALQHEWSGLECPLDLLVFDSEVFVSDSSNERVVAYSLAGVQRAALTGGRRLRCPAGLAMLRDAHGEPASAPQLFVSDRSLHCIFSLSPISGDLLLRFGEPGRAPGQLDWPLGVAVDGGVDECFVADAGNHRISVYRASDGGYLRSFGGKGAGRGDLRAPFGVALTRNLVYVSEQGRGQERVQGFVRGGAAEVEVACELRPPRAGMRAGALNMVSAGHDGRLLVCDDGVHCVHFLVPLPALMRRWRVVAALALALLAAHARATERLYAPGGLGMREAAARFADCAGRLVDVS